MSQRNYWTPKVDNERGKLQPKETDWKLPGSDTTTTRTRYGGQRVGKEPQRAKHSSSDSSFEGYTSSSDEDDGSYVAEKSLKPDPSRFLFEEEVLTKMLEQTAVCQDCGGALRVEYKTVCLATRISLQCREEKCSFVYHSQGMAETTVHAAQEDGYERTTNYAVNVLFVLGFIACGDGGVEAARMLGLLGLPNDTTMAGGSFSIIEKRIGPMICNLSNEILFENLCAEVKLVLNNESDYD